MPRAHCILTAERLASALPAERLANAEDQNLQSGALAAAAESGFDALMWPVAPGPTDEQASGARTIADRCRQSGLRPLALTDLARFPLHHELVEAHPDAFTVRRSPKAAEPVDPRRPFLPSGYAVARLRNSRVQDLLADALADRLREPLNLGFEGICLSPAVPGELVTELKERLSSDYPDAEFLGVAAGAGQAGPEGYTYDYWIRHLDGLPSASPISSETSSEATPEAVLYAVDTPRGGIGSPGFQAQLGTAAVLGGGIVVPLELAAQAAELGATALPAQLSRYAGPLQQLSPASARVTALLRHESMDRFSSRRAALILVNTTAERQSVPSFADFGALAGDFSEPVPIGDGDPGAELEPGEVRVLRVKRKAPVGSGTQTKPAADLRDRARLVLEKITPAVAGGDFAVKRVVGETVAVEAIAFADGHEQIAVELQWRAVDEETWQSARMRSLPNDVWQAEFRPSRLGRYLFRVEAWLDRFGGYARDLAKKVDAGVAQNVDYMEGRALVEAAAGRCKGKLRKALKEVLDTLGETDEQLAETLLAPELAVLMQGADDRPHRITSPPHKLDAERLEARFSSWYELFPRSVTSDPDRHGTLADVIRELPRVRSMGFDTLYFPPIHPIGKANRKGPNNTLTPGPDDPGSPYAIGSAEGGHDAIHPELGSFEDFDRLVKAASEHGLEIALDFAIQASPDHPWLKEHPGWFAWRPDGSMKYAENPPKKYQDIVNVDFYGPDAVPGLWIALRDVVLLWIEHGVKTFRVDNPHTKPLPFWEWMIAEVRARHPEAIFLSEAFTRPTMMYRLAKVGFSQSYTYFTWRDRKHELIEYFSELSSEPVSEFYRPHLFVNTPDINPFFLQSSGRAGFRIRAVLAATLSGLWGVYSGFELCESEPLGEGKEEYLDSEKYQIRVRDWNAPANIVSDITLLNGLRRSHPALQTHLNTRFFLAHNEHILWYGKPSPNGPSAGADDRLTEMIMVMVNLDPHAPQECDFEVPLWQFGLPDDAGIQVEDLAAGHRFTWHGKWQHIRLSPDEPYRIWRVSRG